MSTISSTSSSSPPSPSRSFALLLLAASIAPVGSTTSSTTTTYALGTSSASPSSASVGRVAMVNEGEKDEEGKSEGESEGQEREGEGCQRCSSMSRLTQLTLEHEIAATREAKLLMRLRALEGENAKLRWIRHGPSTIPSSISDPALLHTIEFDAIEINSSALIIFAIGISSAIVCEFDALLAAGTPDAPLVPLRDFDNAPLFVAAKAGALPPSLVHGVRSAVAYIRMDSSRSQKVLQLVDRPGPFYAIPSSCAVVHLVPKESRRALLNFMGVMMKKF
ncbi:hypothetical protein MNV49_000052 [Pseudohyphozyma bogoriensis]|nr:hypothetical protein MNV49_000052 [Pseudohyphozyma bogoriensis]